ncbi:MAG: hypothetical protein E6Q24_05660 [Chitinophagaceae bacterium]|nr:MAG: hypothetical protein E6Q24_05660 [Chitinophagaceae bacterium]
MPQTLSEARYRLAMALQEQKKLIAEIKELRQYIGLLREKPDLDRRNKEIYARFKKGESATDLAGQYGLSKSTVQYICDRAAFQEKKNRDISN